MLFGTFRCSVAFWFVFWIGDMYTSRLPWLQNVKWESPYIRNAEGEEDQHVRPVRLLFCFWSSTLHCLLNMPVIITLLYCNGFATGLFFFFPLQLLLTAFLLHDILVWLTIVGWFASVLCAFCFTECLCQFLFILDVHQISQTFTTWFCLMWFLAA